VKIDKFFKDLVEFKEGLKPFKWEGTLEDGANWTAQCIIRNENKEKKRFKEIEIYVKNITAIQKFYFETEKTNENIDRKYLQSLFDYVIFKNENYVHRWWK